jgi:hypothetical protein
MVGTELLKKHVASDVLAAILGSLKVDKFEGDPEKIHTTFARTQRHYPLLRLFNFTVGDVYPFSRDLEDALSVLQRSRMIRMQNPDYDTYVVTRAGRTVSEALLMTFTESDQQEIKELSEIFEAECGKLDYDSDPKASDD